MSVVHLSLIHIIFVLFLLTKIKCIKDNTTKYLSLDFYTSYFNEENETNYINSRYQSYINIDINIGSNNQLIPMRVELDKYPTYLIPQKYFDDDNITTYNNKISETYKLINTSTFYQNEINSADISEDTIKLGKNNIISNFMFCYVRKMSKNIYITPGTIGLELTPATKYPNYYVNFIDQLKKNNLISDYGITLKYNSKNNGELIFGPDIDLINEKYSNKIKIRVDSHEYNTNNLKWGFQLKSVKVNDIFLNYGCDTYFTLDTEYFLGSVDYSQSILENFFNKYISNNKCTLKKLKPKILYKSIKCEKSIDIKKFPKLVFNLFETNLVIYFTYKDLFELKGNFYYFKIMFNNKTSSKKRNSWTFGRMFFRKYLVTLNKNSKTIAFYNVDNKIAENDNDDSNVNNSNNKKIIIVLIVILTIVCIFLLFTIRRCIKQQLILTNKNRKNVLVNEMYYIPQSDD